MESVGWELVEDVGDEEKSASRKVRNSNLSRQECRLRR